MDAAIVVASKEHSALWATCERKDSELSEMASSLDDATRRRDIELRQLRQTKIELLEKVTKVEEEAQQRVDVDKCEAFCAETYGRQLDVEKRLRLQEQGKLAGLEDSLQAAFSVIDQLNVQVADLRSHLARATEIHANVQESCSQVFKIEAAQMEESRVAQVEQLEQRLAQLDGSPKP